MKRIYITLALVFFFGSVGFSVYTKEFVLNFNLDSVNSFYYISNISFSDQGVTLSYPSKTIFSGNESFLSWVIKIDNRYVFSTVNPNNIYEYNTEVKNIGSLVNHGMITKIKQFEYIYILTGEKGAVYLIDEFNIRKIIDLDYGYIWDIFKLNDKYYMITGNPASLIRFDNDGKYEVIFRSDTENHFLCSVLLNGIVYIGASGSGTIYAFDGKNIKPFLSLNDGEITDIKVYGRYLVVSTYNILTPSQKNSSQQQQQQKPFSPMDVLRNTTGNVYLVNPNTGEYELLFSEIGISSIEVLSNKIIAITSDGRFIEYYEGNKRVSFFNKNFLKLFNFTNELFVASANPAELISLSLNSANYEGVLETKEIPFSNLSSWGRISYDAVLPKDSTIKIFVKGGNTPKEDETWSQWVEVKEFLNLKQFQFIKLKVVISAKGDLPYLKSISIYYTPKNSTPNILAFKSSLSDNYLNLNWNVNDSDGDKLQFNLFVKNYNENKWQRLNKFPLTETNFSINKFLIGNGMFDFMLVVDDSLSNPYGTEKYSTNYLSKIFVDITPPYLDKSTLKINDRGDRVDIEFKVVDNVRLREVYYSNNGIDWFYLLPLDLVVDSSIENFKFTLGKSDYLNVLLIKMVDWQGNVSTERIVF
ncbi:MAG: hypothetical protein ACP5PT_00700 [Brevinematia bacterium]